ncbi:MAG: hypothetical protein FWE05_02980 [Defluviitaleaceae bacterium]|nr:hypothetical protein [Defluviitaleaceae bacterium]
MFEKKQNYVICPFCCHRFHPHEADFRLSKDKKFDEKLFDYYVEVLQLDKKEAKEKSMQFLAVEVADNDAVSFSQEAIGKYGFAHEITYHPPSGKKITSAKRLCPHCHNDLPIGFGMRDTLLISILGDARSGKSVFLTMLIAELENNSDFVSKLTFIGDKNVRDNFYETYQKPLLKDHQLINSTKRKKIPPYAFNFWYQYKNEEGIIKENTIDLIFYDIAGEDLRDDSGIRQNGFNIKDSSGLIFLVDPTNFARLSDLFRFSDAALIDAIPEENSNQSIFNTLYNYFLGFDREKSLIPMALVLSKSDLFSYARFDFFDNKPENRIQNILDGENHKGALNMPSVKGLNQEVRELVSYLGEDGILNNALGCFKVVSCFAVSSLGKKPTVEQISDPITNETIEKGYIDGPLQPFRVKEAFYWILMRNQLLYKHENNRYTLHMAETLQTQYPSIQAAPQKHVPIWRRILTFFMRK